MPRFFCRARSRCQPAAVSTGPRTLPSSSSSGGAQRSGPTAEGRGGLSMAKTSRGLVGADL
eukprot:8070548-Pyramimonas_sp.AAC.1